MYAAAGGASLASRQARQRQRQQKKTQQLQAKLHPPRTALLPAEHGVSTPTRQSRQFHNLPTNYLRTPQFHARKLSASYTAQSKLLLPIDESDTQSMLHIRMHAQAHKHHTHHSHSHAQAHAYQYNHQQQHQQTAGSSHLHGRVSPKLVHRHSGSSGNSFHHMYVPKSATATLPLVSQVETTPPSTPTGTGTGTAKISDSTEGPAVDHDAITVPQLDAVIVTPATPTASPWHGAKIRDELPDTTHEKQPLTTVQTSEDEPFKEPPITQLERKCSVYRMRRSDDFENEVDINESCGVKQQLKELQFNQQQRYLPLLSDEPQVVFKGLNGRKSWQVCAYCEEGICVCEHIECAQGRAAWLERGRRCSVQESQQQAASCHRRWVKRNRIQDVSVGGSSDDEDFLGVLRGPSTFANAFLYMGLGTIALGLVIAFVGTGEKGFKTVELRFIGPSLIGLGLVCCILRILFCICPSHCISSSKQTRKKNGNKVDVDHTTSLLHGESKRVSIARGPAIQLKYPIAHKRSNSRMLNEGMEALRQIATTSLFMQNEQKHDLNRVVPIINEPISSADAPLEMKKLDTVINEMSDDEELKYKNIKEVTAINIISEQTEDTFNANTSSVTTNIMLKTRVSDSNTLETSASTGSKLNRQRFALNQQHTQIEQSQSLQMIALKNDDGVFVETSLMNIKNTLNSDEPSTSTIHCKDNINNSIAVTTVTTLTTTTTSPLYLKPTTNEGLTSTSVTDFKLPLFSESPIYKYDTTITCLPSTLQSSSMGVPLAIPHTYSTAMSPSVPRTPANRDCLTRIQMDTQTASSMSAALDLTTASASDIKETCIPGQVMDITENSDTGHLLSDQQRFSTNIISSPNNTSNTSNMLSHISSPVITPVSFKYPPPLSPTFNSMGASTNGRNTAITTTAPTTAINTTNLTEASTSIAGTPSNKFEAELVLSPAMLGQ
ncbi:uncharacterized protein LOC119687770 [Teleopsis dalmanni]|uniref:uncharacterized protein LOC119687770 n=1 Tax=Teleopsis dalmanni TaxID=139649 RepID=UPI0018CF7A77|nr:uncharacterized protein LOC119687770 [Teleopsis dalmanni]